MVYIVNTMTLAVLFQVNGRAKINKAELIGLILNRRRLLVQMMINIEIACAIYSQTLVQAVVVTSAETAPEDVAITEMTESFSQVFETATGGMWTQMQIIIY